MYARDSSLDAVFGQYTRKRHAAWRNWGSRLTNRITDFILDKPRGFYLSSFRCVTAAVARQVASNSGPYPYIDGLILQVTQRIGGLEVFHSDRAAGQSGYTMRRLIRLWLSTVVNFSVMPLRVATVLGLLMSLFGFMGIGLVVYWRLTNRGPAFGWGSLMSALLLFSGVQLALLGLIGEYLGRMFLTVNQRPQSVIRVIAQGGPARAAVLQGAKGSR
jgi:undecaprenyl-phosphate 4-deoxy-4-formamido-L-arabinose transferase